MQIADQAKETLRPDLAVPPTFSPGCTRCEFAAPCTAMERGADQQAVLRAAYVCLDEDTDTDNLRRSRDRMAAQGESGTINFRWG